MIRFAAGLALLIFTIILGTYFYIEQSDMSESKASGLEEARSKRQEGKELVERMRSVRAQSMVAGDDQKFTIEGLLDIGAPRLEWRFVGQPRQFGNNRALYRHTFRITGATGYAETQELMRKLVTLPGFVPYRYCFGCGLPPRGTPDNLKMVQIEGYLYVYDPNTFY